MQGVDLATKLSYRDAVNEVELFTSMPSASTINRRVREYGEKLHEFINTRLSGNSAGYVQRNEVPQSRSQRKTARYSSQSGRRR